MRYSIITPTLLRDTLRRLCDSIDAQTCGDWQHIVCVDDRAPRGSWPVVAEHGSPDRREVVFCDSGDREGWQRPNYMRHLMWEHATGDYLLYIDDDNYLADPDVLETLKCVTEPVAIFPLEYMGKRQPPLPIKVGRSDGNQVMVHREIGRWPTPGSRSGDGVFIEALTHDHPYEVYDGRALVVYEYAREGVA